MKNQVTIKDEVKLDGFAPACGSNNTHSTQIEEAKDCIAGIDFDTLWENFKNNIAKSFG